MIIFLTFLAIIFGLALFFYKRTNSTQDSTTTELDLHQLLQISTTDDDDEFEQCVKSCIENCLTKKSDSNIKLTTVKDAIDMRTQYLNELYESALEEENEAIENLIQELANIGLFLKKCRRHKTRKIFRQKKVTVLQEAIAVSVFNGNPMIFFMFRYNKDNEKTYFEVLYDFLFFEAYEKLSSEKKQEIIELMTRISKLYESSIDQRRKVLKISERKERLENFVKQYGIKLLISE